MFWKNRKNTQTAKPSKSTASSAFSGAKIRSYGKYAQAAVVVVAIVIVIYGMFPAKAPPLPSIPEPPPPNDKGDEKNPDIFQRRVDVYNQKIATLLYSDENAILTQCKKAGFVPTKASISESQDKDLKAKLSKIDASATSSASTEITEVYSPEQVTQCFNRWLKEVASARDDAISWAYEFTYPDVDNVHNFDSAVKKVLDFPLDETDKKTLQSIFDKTRDDLNSASVKYKVTELQQMNKWVIVTAKFTIIDTPSTKTLVLKADHSISQNFQKEPKKKWYSMVVVPNTAYDAVRRNFASPSGSVAPYHVWGTAKYVAPPGPPGSQTENDIVITPYAIWD